jgi:2-haloacid dehalogenase
MARLARLAGFCWDCIIPTELFGAHNPDPRTYQGALKLLGLKPDGVMLVAAHPSNLRAGRACGLQTAYVA